VLAHFPPAAFIILDRVILPDVGINCKGKVLSPRLTAGAMLLVVFYSQLFYLFPPAAPFAGAAPLTEAADEPSGETIREGQPPFPYL
jgi:hypothetical protein